MAVTDSIKDILSIKIKPRQDSYYDQFSRIFMVKVMMIGTLLVGLNWYSDKMTCIIPGSAGIGDGFVSSACWINGLYIYEDIRFHNNEIGYYGLPRDINTDGMFSDGKLCHTTDSSHRKVPNCKAMEKTFFLQYQYMTFFLAALAVLYYAPYAVFLLNNQDIISLKKSIDKGSVEDIVNNYFNEHVNSKMKMRLHIAGNIGIKVLYIVTSVAAFSITDNVLLGGFKTYGIKWLHWAKLNNSLAYDYMGRREFPKPGNELLPSFGFCEVHEAAQDIKYVITNKHKFVCEISQHILYQYVFIIIWFAMVTSIAVSAIGLCMQIADHVISISCFLREGPGSRKMYKKLTLRQCDYLEFIRRKNMPLYGEVLEELREYGGIRKGKKIDISEAYEI